MKYKKLHGVILKKQNYREADQIITVWTREAGKVRILARSVRLSKSKLCPSLSELSWVELQIVGKHLPILTSAKSIKSFSSLLTDLKKTAIGFYAAELMLKMTADEHPNEEAFDLLVDFLHCLDKLDYSVKYYPLLESFSLKLLSALGFSIEYARTSFKIPQELSLDLLKLTQKNFVELHQIELGADRIESLHSLINRFIEFILERNLKSEPFLISI